MVDDVNWHHSDKNKNNIGDYHENICGIHVGYEQETGDKHDFVEIGANYWQ